MSSNRKTMELRGIMSARNAGEGFDLECQVREKIITYIRNGYPECLPRQRLAKVVTDQVSAPPRP